MLLVVDDSEPDRVIAMMYERLGGRGVVEVRSGEEALRRFVRERFDAVLVHVRLPGLSGLETCRQLRQLPRGRDIPIAFLTDVDDTRAIEDAVAAGGDDILIEPLRPGEVEARLRALLRTYEILRMERLATALAVQQRRQLEQLAAQKDALAEFLVHDLKSPLASAMFTLTELLSQSVPDQYRAPLISCLSATESASRMVMNLLDLSGAARLSVRASASPVSSLFHHLRERFAARLDVRRVSLRTRASTTHIWADGDLLRRIAENLVDNALRYAPSGSEIDLGVDKRDGGGVLAILDRGPGVPPAHRERIFDRFVQLDPDASSRASRGLGLAFCRLAVEAHGGSIRVEDGPDGGGACFSAFFPGPEGMGPC